MKKNLLFSLLLVFTSLIQTINAQAPDWLWAKSAGGKNSDQGQSICTDASGNILVTGNFNSPSITFGNTSLTNKGDDDIFIIKYDETGNLMWAKSVGGSKSDLGQDISTDASGNILVTGKFNSPSITFDTITLINKGGYDIFVVKYDVFGNVLWAKTAGGFSYDFGSGISSDASGNVLVTGSFMSSSITFDTILLANVHYQDIFVLKYDRSGKIIWAKSVDGSDYDFGCDISTDASENILVTGYFSSSSIKVGTSTLTNKGQNDLFVMKYDAFGNVLWTKSAGGKGNDRGESIYSDEKGSVLVCGNFTSPFITFDTITLTNSGSGDIFIVKYDGGGNVLWAKSAEGNSFAHAQGISTDANNNILVTGSFYSPSLTFDTITLIKMGESDYADIFVLKYGVSGDLLWAKSAGGIGDDYGQSVSTDANGNVLVTGQFNSPSFILGNSTLVSTGINYDVFIAKIAATPSGIAEDQATNTLSIYPNPFNTFTTIELNTPINNGQLNVYNAHGQLVKEMKNITGQTFTLGRDNLPKGLYFLSLSENNKEIVSKKLIIND